MSQENVNNKVSRKLDLKSFLPSTRNSFLTILLIISMLMNGGFGPLTRRGFFCDDTSIRYPIRPDTVSFPVLLVFALLLPIGVISYLEKRLHNVTSFAMHKQTLRRSSNCPETDIELAEEFMPTETRDQIKRRAVNSEEGSTSGHLGQSDTRRDNRESSGPSDSVEFRRGHRSQDGLSANVMTDKQMFMFGFIATAFLTGVAKTTSGRMRPHFMARCQPNVDCTLPDNLFRYIDDFKCTDPSLRPRDYNYITTSFPSGHASIIFYSMLYLIFYVDFTISTIIKFKTARGPPVLKYNPLAVHSIYVSMVSLAIYISLTRVSDYHHHPVDVLTGALLGSVVAVIMSKFLLTQRFAQIRSSSPVEVDTVEIVM